MLGPFADVSVRRHVAEACKPRLTSRYQAARPGPNQNIRSGPCASSKPLRPQDADTDKAEDPASSHSDDERAKARTRERERFDRHECFLKLRDARGYSGSPSSVAKRSPHARADEFERSPPAPPSSSRKPPSGRAATCRFAKKVTSTVHTNQRLSHLFCEFPREGVAEKVTLPYKIRRKDDLRHESTQ